MSARAADKAPAGRSSAHSERPAAAQPVAAGPAPSRQAVPARPAQPSGSKIWLFIGAFGAVAIAAAVMVLVLPTKPSSPQGETEPGVGRTALPTKPNSVQTPVPVHVTPVTPDGDKPGTPTEPGQTAAKTGPATDNPGSAANPANSPPGPPTEPDEPDDSDSVGTTSKPGKGTREEHRAAAKAARAAARAAAKAAKATEVESAPPQAPLKTLTQDVLRQNMLRAESRFKSCAKEAWGSYVTISILVDNSGSVQKADLIGPLGTSATGRCISEQIRKQHFPPFTEGSSKQFVWSYQIPAAN